MLHLLGLDQADAEKFKRWANAFMLSAPMSPEERTEFMLRHDTYWV